MASTNSFNAHGELTVGEQSYEIYRIDTVEGHETLPYSLKVLLENLLRTEDGANITADDHSEMIARGEYILQAFGPDADKVAFLVDGAEGALDLAVALTASGVASQVKRALGPVQGAHVLACAASER